MPCYGGFIPFVGRGYTVKIKQIYRISAVYYLLGRQIAAWNIIVKAEIQDDRRIRFIRYHRPEGNIELGICHLKRKTVIRQHGLARGKANVTLQDTTLYVYWLWR